MTSLRVSQDSCHLQFFAAVVDGIIAKTLTKPCFADDRIIPDCAAANLESNRLGELNTVHVVALDHGVYDAEVPVPCGFPTNPYTCVHNSTTRSELSFAFNDSYITSWQSFEAMNAYLYLAIYCQSLCNSQ